MREMTFMETDFFEEDICIDIFFLFTLFFLHF